MTAQSGPFTQSELYLLKKEAEEEADNSEWAACVVRLCDEAYRMVGALEYITSPTMGRPGDIAPRDFAMQGSTEQAARYALQLCIDQARAALGKDR